MLIRFPGGLILPALLILATTSLRAAVPDNLLMPLGTSHWSGSTGGSTLVTDPLALGGQFLRFTITSPAKPWDAGLLIGGTGGLVRGARAKLLIPVRCPTGGRIDLAMSVRKDSGGWFYQGVDVPPSERWSGLELTLTTRHDIPADQLELRLFAGSKAQTLEIASPTLGLGTGMPAAIPVFCTASGEIGGTPAEPAPALQQVRLHAIATAPPDPAKPSARVPEPESTASTGITGTPSSSTNLLPDLASSLLFGRDVDGVSEIAIDRAGSYRAVRQITIAKKLPNVWDVHIALPIAGPLTAGKRYRLSVPLRADQGRFAMTVAVVRQAGLHWLGNRQVGGDTRWTIFKLLLVPTQDIPANRLLVQLLLADTTQTIQLAQPRLEPAKSSERGDLLQVGLE